MAKSPPPPRILIADTYEVDFARPLPEASGGQPAFAVIDRTQGRAGLMAVRVPADAPARAADIQRFQAGPVAGILSPLAFGPARDPSGQDAPFLICQAPPGPPLVPPGPARFRPWDEAALLAHVLRPAAQALEGLRQRHVTHRAIRPANLFRASSLDPVVLGCAWATPPAFLQPAIYEPPYVSACHPTARGEGSIADDIYALGVTLLVLALGEEPCRDLAAEELVWQQLERGSLPVLVGDRRLPPVIGDLLRGMLAEDPEHRPTPALLADTEVARGRRVAARPPRRSQRPLDIGTRQVWSARTLAHAIARDPEAGLQSLRSGSINTWIRRGLGDSALAVRLDEAVKTRAAQEDIATARDDATLVSRAVALLDPLAPMAWNGQVFWPDGLGPTLAAAVGGTGALATTDIAEFITEEAIGVWATARAERCDAALMRLNAHQYRALAAHKGPGGGMTRLLYHLNPLLPCLSPQLRGDCVIRLEGLLPALDAAAAGGRLAGDVAVDPNLTAFVAARGEAGYEAELAALAAARRPEQLSLATLRLYAGIQMRTRSPSVPALASALARAVSPALAIFSGASRRAWREQALAGIAATGQLAGMLALLADPEAIAADRTEREQALAEIAAIDRQIATLRAGRIGRAASAAHLGHEVVGTAGALGLIYALMSLVMG